MASGSRSYTVPDLAKEYPCGASEFTSAEPLRPNIAVSLRQIANAQTPTFDPECAGGCVEAAFEHDRSVLSS